MQNSEQKCSLEASGLAPVLPASMVGLTVAIVKCPCEYKQSAEFWGRVLVVQRLARMHKALGSKPLPKKKKKRETGLAVQIYNPSHWRGRGQKGQKFKPWAGHMAQPLRD